MFMMDPLEQLNRKYPWPAEQPNAPVTSWGRGIDSKELLLSYIPKDATVVLEIGSLFGTSARFFAEVCPNAQVICIDPWSDIKDRPFLANTPEIAAFVNTEKDGFYNVFLASNWGYRERFIPLRGFSPDMLLPVVAEGIQPQLVYVDGAHVYEDVLADIATSRSLFPATMICGDDWNWPGVRRAVEYFAENRGDAIHTDGNTWVLESDGTSKRFNAHSALDFRPPTRRAGFFGAMRRVMKWQRKP